MRELVIGGETLQNANGLQEVRAFWSTEACGTHFIQRFTDEHDFFSKYREFRYRTEWHIPAFASFAQAKGKRVLEIGCGNGADGVMFTSHGAHYTGVDLTPQAVDATRRHFAAEGLDGQFRLEDAERLSFADDSFDIVYSYGVLHHTPAPQRAVHEVYRVLKPGGVALVMLYHRHSFNYYVRILGYMRARVLLKIVSRLGRSKADRNRSAAGQLVGQCFRKAVGDPLRQLSQGRLELSKGPQLRAPLHRRPGVPVRLHVQQAGRARAVRAFPHGRDEGGAFPAEQVSRRAMDPARSGAIRCRKNGVAPADPRDEIAACDHRIDA